ncbi:MAG TPA: TIGR01777 family oxidoreductase [Bryobacteraceae bacterium]|nr:TIGR01777 family oxidoreductase [Bryobacteraceae bacterium]
MNVTLTGATGFVGSRLVAKLLAGGHQVHVLGRRRSSKLPASVSFSEWNAASEPPPDTVAGADAVIHLAGEPVGQRWTSQAKARIRDSRVEGTRLLVSALARQPRRPAVLVCASAIGIYGSRGDETLTETSASGQGFLAEVVTDWESAAQAAEPFGIRVVPVRFGIVLGPGGALAKMLPAFRLGVGGRIGSGRQWMSWIHIVDAVDLSLFALGNSALRGPVNAVSPHPVTNLEFTREFAAALHRPAIFPVPEAALKLVFGEMAGMLLGSQRVLPEAAEAAGFRFRYPELRPALEDVLASRNSDSEAQ